MVGVSLAQSVGWKLATVTLSVVAVAQQIALFRERRRYGRIVVSVSHLIVAGACRPSMAYATGCSLTGVCWWWHA